MKKLSIFSFPTHGQKDRTSGVDYARIILPSEHLNKLKGFEVKVYNPREKKKTNWPDVAANYDIIFFNYTVDPWGFAAMGCMARKYGRKLVLDIDDNLWGVLPDNPSYQQFLPGGENIKNFTCICNEVDAITTTSQYLKNVIHHHTGVDLKKIFVMPNRIDLNLYEHVSPFKNENTITLMHHGSTTHFLDLGSEEFVAGVDMIMKEYPNVVFKTVGAFLPQLRQKWGNRYSNEFGDRDIYKWVKNKFPTYMDEADIMLTPLVDNGYNRCKSGIKYLENSSASKAGCYQAIRQYKEVITDGKNGYLCMWRDQWFKAIKELIDNPQKRQQMGENAYNDVVANHQMKDHVKPYADLFNSLMEYYPEVVAI